MPENPHTARRVPTLRLMAQCRVENYTGSALKRKDRTGSYCGADHSAKRGRDLPFLHSFDPFYPQARGAQRSLRQLREKPAGIWRLWPVDKKDQNCVEREDLCLALRYDPPFR